MIPTPLTEEPGGPTFGLSQPLQIERGAWAILAGTIDEKVKSKLVVRSVIEHFIVADHHLECSNLICPIYRFSLGSNRYRRCLHRPLACGYHRYPPCYCL